LFTHDRLHVEHVGPDIPLPSHRHVQSLSCTAPLAQVVVGHADGAAGFNVPIPARDSIVHVSEPRRMLKNPPSPNH
jgi:hypothetical protein